MCVRLMKFLFVISLINCSGSAFSEGLAGSGEVLAMLQKIQGQWRTTCKPLRGTKRSFSISKLSVSYTHFSFKTTEYEGGRCVMVKGEREWRYRFALRGSQVGGDGKPVFAIDFKGEQKLSEAGSLYPLNIVRVEGGALFLGDDFFDAKGGRLNRLNKQIAYIR